MKKFNFWLLAFFLFGISQAAISQITVTQEFPILAGTDDAEQDLLGGGMDLSSSDIEMTQDGSSDQIIGLRFANVTIPAQATIDAAYIQVTVDEVHTTGIVNVLMASEDAANPSTFTPAPNDILNRAASNAFLGDLNIWTVGAFEAVGDQGINQQSPDISDLIANSVSHPNWDAGNAISILMVDPIHAEIPGFTGNQGVKRVFQTYNNSPANAAKLVVTYTIPDIYYTGTFPVPLGASWLYNDQGENLDDQDWTSLAWEGDSTWAWGDGELGYGDGDEATVLSFGGDPDNKYPSYYLRHIFEVEDASLIDSLLFSVKRDDGAVVYVNGTEVFRMNMPEGEISYNSFALSAIGGSAENVLHQVTTGNLLQDGLNVIAVSVHQNNASSSDLSFDMSVDFVAAPPAAASFPFAAGSVWNYLDTGESLDDIDWTSLDFDDYAWMSGPGPLGYGDPVNTLVSFGPDPGNKYITTYFRRSMDIDLASMPDTVVFGILADDGALVYVNGTEVARFNMPEGEINYLTFSSSIISGSAEETYNMFLVDSEVFVDGLNQIAVELHNRDNFSSDARFDMYIEAVPEPPFVNPPADCSVPRVGCFTSILPTAQTPFVVIPESHRFQMLFQQGDIYTVGGGVVPGLHDYTGYLGNDTEGTIFVNHETTPGGVSMVDVIFNDSTMLWEVLVTEPVDFYNDDLVTTTRNCSGGQTPWGTSITCEETFNTGDVNNDGYVDVGWHVEISPETRAVMDYENDGVQDKLWAMGRMSHENIAVANDSITAYYGEDGGTQCVYKYVADAAGNLSSGTLYVLVLDQALSGGEPTVTTGSWVVVPNETQADRNNTNSIAGALGGTNFNGVEDVEIGTIDGRIYFTSKGNGRVYRFSDMGDGVENFETFVGGTSYPIITNNGAVIEPWGGGNDNLTFDDQGNLWVLQDGTRNHVWLVRPNHTQSLPKVELFMTTPAGSEPCGLTFSPDYKYGFISIQHPSGSNGPQIDASGNEVAFNLSATLVFALKENLGAQPPAAAFEANSTQIIAGESVTFTDNSTFAPTSWVWTFEGGTPATSTEQNPVVTYNEPGNYEVTLVASNAEGSGTETITSYMSVLVPAPVVEFGANITEAFAGEAISFTDLSTNTPTSWEWTFEGGTPATSTEQNPTVVFSEVGTYDVSLVSSNGTGSGETNIKADYIVSLLPAPAANFEASETSIIEGEEVTFTDLSTNEPANWLWVFEGGTPATSTEQNPTVTYDTPGFYDVALISTNESGSGPVELKIDYIFVDQLVSTESITSATDITLYPNPTEGVLNITLNLEGGKELVIELFDMTGRKIADLIRTRSRGGEENFAFDIARHVEASQILLVRISAGEQVSSNLIQFMK